MNTTRPDPLRVLLAPETFNLGETSRAVETATALTNAGHAVHIMGYSQRFARYVADAGFALNLLSPELGEHEAEQLLAFDQGRTARHPFTVEMVRDRSPPRSA